MAREINIAGNRYSEEGPGTWRHFDGATKGAVVPMGEEVAVLLVPHSHKKSLPNS